MYRWVKAGTYEPFDSKSQRKTIELNIVEEIAIACSLPMPPVYLLDVEEINAFAAGTSPDNAAITVTKGCLNLLNRDELQGVLAHEFGHIYNRDMTIWDARGSHGDGFFLCLVYWAPHAPGSGLLLKAWQWRSQRRQSPCRHRIDFSHCRCHHVVFWFNFASNGESPTGVFSRCLFGTITRNPQGIANALKKIASFTVSDMPRNGQPFSHLYFNEHPHFGPVCLRHIPRSMRRNFGNFRGSL